MEAITFSPAQIHIFNLVSHITSEKALEQLREQLAAFYAKQVDAEMDKLWESGVWNEKKLQSLRGSHFRTTYINGAFFDQKSCTGIRKVFISA